jgi:hypothetical protein
MKWNRQVNPLFFLVMSTAYLHPPPLRLMYLPTFVSPTFTKWLPIVYRISV